MRRHRRDRRSDLCLAANAGAPFRATAGADYAARLFALPPFLLGPQNASPTAADIAAGLRLTGHFLLERVLRPHGRDMPRGAPAPGRAWRSRESECVHQHCHAWSSPWANCRSKTTISVPSRWRKALGERYLAYALSTITQRALPDVRDGLKPVHRRILMHAMRLLGLNPDAGFKKCARVVGDVIGKYHPHGDQSRSMTRWCGWRRISPLRYPLVDGQGNFGNVDGDNAAAMRYTESRLTEAAQALLEGLDENAVDFRATYDGEDEEPVVLPAAFPNLLANGSGGIAVGMATSIPPHNLGELCGALIALIENPNLPGRDSC